MRKERRDGVAGSSEDPNTPKMARSGYVLFVSEQREVEANGFGGTVGFAELGRRWRLLGEEERKKYIDKAKESREIFGQAIAERMSSDADQQLQAKTKAQRSRKRQAPNDSGAPKRPKLPFSLFSESCRDEWLQSGMSFTEMGNEAKRRWRELSDDDLQVWKQKWSALTAEYEEKVRQYKYSREALKRPCQDLGAPKRPPNAFFLFNESCRGELLQNGMSCIEAAQEAGRRWNQMSEEAREPWRGKSQVLHAEYQEKLKQCPAGEAKRLCQDLGDSSSFGAWPQLEGLPASDDTQAEQTQCSGRSDPETSVLGAE
mmetsp:Transcript_53123/g.121325  ORF Transcript_53123/g.121325 Transcript_53123/m.121325 type:complete len:315 (+) Transcript_53123:1239-2183(+)